MSWFDNLMHGDWFTGGARPSAPESKAATPAAPSEPFWGDSAWAKATGIAPWARMLGGGGAPSHADPSKTEDWDRLVDHQKLTGYGTRELPAHGANAGDIARGDWHTRANSIEGEKKVTGFERDEKGGFKTPEYNRWKATGTSWGNSEEDVNNHALERKTKVSGMPTIFQPALDKIGNGDPTKSGYDPRSSGYNVKSGPLDKDAAAEKAKADGADYNDSGSFRASKYGSYSGNTGLQSQKWDPEKKMMVNDPSAKFTVTHGGKGSAGIAGWEGQWGAEEKGGWRATHVSKDGNTSASAEAGLVANAGASGAYGFDTSKGLYAQGGVGAKAGAYAQADADLKSDPLTLGGVDFDAGIGVHGDLFLGAKAGMNGQVGFGPDFWGAKGDIGAMAGAELNGDVHGNFGPVAGKVGGSLIAGAGIGAEGDISYKDGKFHVGGKMYAALGVGGSLSGDVTIDVGAMGKAAYPFGEEMVEGMGDVFGDAYDMGANAASGIASTASDVYDVGASAISSVLSW